MNPEFKSLRLKVAVLCAALSLGFNAGAVTTNSVAVTNAPMATTNSTANTNNINTGTDLSSFKIIADRNIFSANRSGHVASRGSSRKPTKVDTFTLVGTVDYSKGEFAIFDGSSSSYRKSVKTGDTFAGFKIKDIDLDHVTIATTNGADTVLRVGTQMRRIDDGDWAIGTGPAPQIAKSSSSDDGETPQTASADSENNSSADEPAPSAETSDVLKRLMQKRKAEVKNESE